MCENLPPSTLLQIFGLRSFGTSQIRYWEKIAAEKIAGKKRPRKKKAEEKMADGKNSRWKKQPME